MGIENRPNIELIGLVVTAFNAGFTDGSTGMNHLTKNDLMQKLELKSWRVFQKDSLHQVYLAGYAMGKGTIDLAQMIEEHAKPDV